MSLPPQDTQQKIQQLYRQHQKLEQQLLLENQKPYPNNDILSQIKKEKLKIKDQIAQQSKSLPHNTPQE